MSNIPMRPNFSLLNKYGIQHNKMYGFSKYTITDTLKDILKLFK